MNAPHTSRNPQADAQALVGDGLIARVLEPSPPAINDGPFFADDPVALDGHHRSTVIQPAGFAGGPDWTSWLTDNPEHGAWAAEHWLGGERRLPTTPANLAETRVALHRLAVYVIAPVRHAANGKFGLRWTAGGFGTPFFGDKTATNRQVRVEGTDLIDQRDDEVRIAPITTLQAAADFLESDIDTKTAAEHDSPAAGDVNEPLTIDPAAATFLGHWYGMAYAALETVRADAASVDPSRPQLWPGHFDPAIEVGDEVHRGSYGASPGDDGIDEPYLYLSVWDPEAAGIDSADSAWNAPSFIGAILKLSDFPSGVDPVTVAAEFWMTHRDKLAG